MVLSVLLVVITQVQLMTEVGDGTIYQHCYVLTVMQTMSQNVCANSFRWVFASWHGPADFAHGRPSLMSRMSC